MNAFQQKILAISLLFMLAISIPLTIVLVNQNQDNRTKAAGSTQLSFVPTSTAGSPITKGIGEVFPLNIALDPGANMVSFVKFQVKYDPTVLELDQTNPFTINQSAFPTKVEGPVLGNGLIAESLSVGSDPTKAIKTVTTVGTLNFKAIASTSGVPTEVSYTSETQTLSAGANDQAGENVLAATSSAFILVGSASASGTPAPTATTTILNFNLFMHGVGSAGDNPNPNGSTLSNKNPLHPQRDIDVIISNSSNQVVASKAAAVLYDESSGTFKGALDLGANFPQGNYNIKIKTDRYLRKRVPGVQTIKPLIENTIPDTQLVAGDVNDDNTLNVLDYNAFLDCGYGQIKPLPIADPEAPFNTKECQVHTPVINVDVDDNGVVDSPDYNLFLRELSVQSGD